MNKCDPTGARGPWGDQHSLRYDPVRETDTMTYNWYWYSAVQAKRVICDAPLSVLSLLERETTCTIPVLVPVLVPDTGTGVTCFSKLHYGIQSEIDLTRFLVK